MGNWKENDINKEVSFLDWGIKREYYGFSMTDEVISLFYC